MYIAVTVCDLCAEAFVGRTTTVSPRYTVYILYYIILTVYFRTTLTVHLRPSEPFVGDKDSLVISTIGLADIGAVPYRLQPLDDRPDLYQVHTILLPSSLQPFPVWIIVVTVIGALLLLAAITYGLYKVSGEWNWR